MLFEFWCKLKVSIYKGWTKMNDKKPTSTFAKITKVVIWIMLIVTVGTVVLGAVAAIS